MRKFLAIISEVIHFLVSSVFLLLLTYFFGHKLLSGGLIGNDAANTFSFVLWLNKFYPRIPLWFPLEGSGVSFVQGYQVVPELLVVWLHRFSTLSLIQAYELLSFLSVYVSALGVYLLGWFRLKSKTVGLIAAVFFLLTPVTWVWSVQAGFFASAISLAFFAPAFIFADMYAEYMFGLRQGKGQYVVFFLAVVFLSLSLLMHFTTFMALFIILFLYLSFFGLIRNKHVLANIKKIFLALVPTFGVSVLLSAFWFVSFYVYNSAANWDLSEVPNPEQFPKIAIDAFLSIPTSSYYSGSVWTFSFPIFIWVLALIAIPIAFFYSRRIFSLAIIGAFTLYGSLFIGVYVLASKISGFFASGFSPRIFWIIYNFWGPLLAAFAIVGGVNLLIKLPFRKLITHEKTKTLMSFRFLVNFFIIPIISMSIAVYVIVSFRSVDKQGGQSFAHYGPISAYPYMFTNYEKGKVLGGGLDLRDIWQKTLFTSHNSALRVVAQTSKGVQTLNCAYEVDKDIADLCEKKGYKASWNLFLQQLQPANWPPFVLGNEMYSDNGLAKQKQFLSTLPHADNLRVDISPNSYGGLLEQFPLIRQDISILNTYTFQLSLNHIFWAQSQGVFYNNGGLLIYKEPAVTTQLSDYFGLHAIVLGAGDSPNVVSKYKTPDWTISQLPTATVVTPKVSYPLFDLNNKPSVLLIGQQKYAAYQTLFTSAVLGAIPFHSAYVVMGKGSPADYTLDTLKKFDSVVLYAYGPKSDSSSWDVLKQYVQQGGSLFVDTGWQYTVPDWQMQKTYDILPTDNLEWKDLPTTRWYQLAQSEQGIAVSKFAPLIWNGTSWGVSTSKNLKDWAHPVLSYDGYPLVAEGKFGLGRVVWSGMNLFSHSLSNNNMEEILFEKTLFHYLLPARITTNFPVTMSREYPDVVTFTLDNDIPANSNLYFREAYIANWQAYVVHQGVKQSVVLYRGGPGLLFAKLPALQKNDQIVLTFALTPFEQFAYILSLFTLLGLIMYSIDHLDHLFLEKKLTGKLTSHISRTVSRRVEKVKTAIKQGTQSTLKSFWDEDS